MIKVSGLTKKFGGHVAVDDLNFEIRPGELFGFLGPNGAGKTTTIKMLSGILKPTAGKVMISGLDIQKRPEQAKKLIGLIPDDPYLYDRLTAREYLCFIGGLYQMDKKRIDLRSSELFGIFDMDGWVDRKCEEFSHGMRQKLVFCAALLHDPTVLIVDEPMVGLDPQSTRLVKDLMKKLASNGATVFVSTHVLSIVEELCDRIGIINGGKLIELGTMSQLRDKAAGSNADLETLFLELTQTRD